MGSLVQSPEVADAVVSGIQASVTPTGSGGGIGSFLSKLLPAANAELEKYDKENKAKAVALGQNDKLNSMYREVSFLDRKNYAAGREYQNTINGQILLAKDFQNKVNNMDANNPDPDALMRLNEEYNTATVDTVALSTLPTEIKEVLYASTLKQNAAYTAMIDKKLKRITADNVATTRMNSLASLTKSITREEHTPEELMTIVQAHRESSAAGMKLVNSDVSAEDIDKVFQEDVLASFTHGLTTLAAGEDGRVNVEHMEMLEATVMSMEGVSLKTATAISKKAMEFKAEALSIADRQGMELFEELSFKVQQDPKSVQDSDFNDFIAMIDGVGNMTAEGKFNVRKKTNTLFLGRNQELARGKKLYDATKMLDGDFERAGVSPAKGHSEALTAYQNQYAGDNYSVGTAMIQQFANGAEYSSEGTRKGAEVLVRPFLGYLTMDANKVEDDEYTQLRANQFASFRDLYNKAAQSNGTLAADLLAGIPDDLRESFITTMRAGGSLEDLRSDAKSPKATAANYANSRKAAEGMTAEMFNLGGKPIGDFFGGQDSMSRHIQSNYLDDAKVATEESLGILVQRNGNSSNSEQAAIVMQETFLRNKAGLSPAIRNAYVARMMRSLKTSDGAPMDEAFWGDADTATRKELAEKYNVKASDIIVSFNSTGDIATYKLYDTTRDDRFGLRDGKGSRVQAVPVPTSDLLADARALYTTASTRTLRPTVNQTLEQEASRVMGVATFTDSATGSPRKVGITVPFVKATGGNPTVATNVLESLSRWYGFTTTPQNTPQGRMYGLSAHAGVVNKDIAKRFEAASGDVEATMRVQGDYFAQRLRSVNMEQAFTRTGVKAPTGDMYNPQGMSSATLLYSAAYLEGNKGLYGNNKGVKGVVTAMQEPTYAKAVATFKKSPLYDTTGQYSKRNSMYLEALKQHFKLKGK